MTNFEKFEAEISSILEKYKKRFPTKSVNNTETKTDKVIISESDILRTPAQIVTDLANEMDYAKGSHIIKYGNENEADIEKKIKTSLQTFSEYQQTIQRYF